MDPKFTDVYSKSAFWELNTSPTEVNEETVRKINPQTMKIF